VGDRADLVIINYDIAGKYLAELQGCQWDLLILDESHAVKNPKAQRTVAIFGRQATKKEVEADQDYRAELAGANPNDRKAIFVRHRDRLSQPGITARFELHMTGTPILNRPKELWTSISRLAPDTFNNFFRFAKRYCGAHSNGYGWDMGGATNLDELQQKLRASLMVRRLKSEVLTELPAKRRQIVQLPANGASDLVEEERDIAAEQERVIEDLLAAVQLAKVNDVPESEYLKAVEALQKGQRAAFTEVAKVSHRVALAKVPMTVSYLKELVESGQKVLVFAHHLDVLDALASEFPKAVRLDGRNSVEERQLAVDRFQQDPEANPFIGGIRAAGVGLTLTAASLVVFHEIDWVPGVMNQAEDRAHRIGQKDSVLVQTLVLEGSLDAIKVRTLIEKQEIIDRALDRADTRDLAEPVTGGKSVTITFREIEEQAPLITPEQAAAVHLALRMLAGVCDGAQKRDQTGFNGCDAQIGHSMARQGRLTAKQAVLGRKIIAKYHKQLGEEILREAGVKLKGK
jgi:SWI/SNF-related matrix-associated actin-dependent regulator of chromatin subfamily A-like protein 1